MKLCILDICPNPSQRRGLCSSHYAFHRYHGTIDDVAPKAYRHWLTDVNTETRTALCSVCGFTKIHGAGLDRHGKHRFKCATKTTPNVYTFGDGDTIPHAEALAARLRLYKEQNGHCAICKRHESVTGTLCLDHCHETGKIRGLLCGGCNRGLGFFRDSPENLKAASEYVTR